MLLTFQLLTIVVLLIVAYQDFKQRQISWILIPVLFSLCMFLGLKENSFTTWLNYFVLNLLFLLFQIALLWITLAIRKRKFENIIDRYIGLGDLLFFLVICAAFSTINFLVFYTVSLVLSLSAYMIYLLMRKSEVKAEVPLAGLVSLILISTMIFKYFSQISFFNDNMILAILNR